MHSIKQPLLVPAVTSLHKHLIVLRAGSREQVSLAFHRTFAAKWHSTITIKNPYASFVGFSLISRFRRATTRAFVQSLSEQSSLRSIFVDLQNYIDLRCRALLATPLATRLTVQHGEGAI